MKYEVYLETQNDEGEWIEAMHEVLEATDREDAIFKWADIHTITLCQSQYDHDNNTCIWNWLGDGVEARLFKDAINELID